jgi:branched-chain amino acid transport system ATP-binding protein
MTIELEVRDLRLSFGELVALNKLSFKARRGEIFALVGPNGAGKTAALNCINGVYKPDSGEVIFDGRNISGAPLHKMAQLGIGRSFQHVELFPHMNVMDNLLVGRHAKMKAGVVTGGLYFGPARGEERRHREWVEEVIDFFELNPYREHAAGNLPYGVQKLVGVARALAMQARVLLLDEPSTGLVREEKENLARFFLRMKHELKLTIIWVEHDMQMVRDLADQMLVMNYGVEIATGTPAKVGRNKKVHEAYLGREGAVSFGA